MRDGLTVYDIDHSRIIASDFLEMENFKIKILKTKSCWAILYCRSHKNFPNPNYEQQQLREQKSPQKSAQFKSILIPSGYCTSHAESTELSR